MRNTETIFRIQSLKHYHYKDARPSHSSAFQTKTQCVPVVTNCSNPHLLAEIPYEVKAATIPALQPTKLDSF